MRGPTRMSDRPYVDREWNLNPDETLQCVHAADWRLNLPFDLQSFAYKLK
jgi:hypothetical protein